MNTTTPNTIPAMAPLLIICWRTGAVCISGDWVVLAGINAVVLGRVTVAVSGASEELCPPFEILDELVKPAAEDGVEEVVMVDSVEETKLVLDIEALDESDTSLSVLPPPSVML